MGKGKMSWTTVLMFTFPWVIPDRYVHIHIYTYDIAQVPIPPKPNQEFRSVVFQCVPRRNQLQKYNNFCIAKNNTIYLSGKKGGTAVLLTQKLVSAAACKARSGKTQVLSRLHSILRSLPSILNNTRLLYCNCLVLYFYSKQHHCLDARS